MRKVLNSGDGAAPKSANDAETGLLDAQQPDGHKAKYFNNLSTHRKKEMRAQITKLSFMIAMTFVVFLVELFYGYISNSVALIADAFHMLSDVLALTVALACILVGFFKLKSQLQRE